MTPAATWTFCWRTASTTSSAVMLRSAIFCGIEPDAHGVIARAEHLHAADAFDLGQPVLDVQHRVIAQIEHVVAVVRRDQMHHHGEVGRALDRGDAEIAGHFRQARQRLVDAVLHQLLRQIGIGAELEGDGQGQGAVGGGLREHVEHVLGAVDLLFQRRRHRLGDGARDWRRETAPSPPPTAARPRDIPRSAAAASRSGRPGRWRPRSRRQKSAGR